MIKIIIIEDQKLLRDLISDTLSENGFEVIATSADAKDSISLCENHLPDIVLMDICTKNNSNGIFYGGIIKQKFSQIKVVLMTRGHDISFIDNAKNAKIDSFIYKNIGKDTLINTLKNTLSGYSTYPDKNANQNILSSLSDKEISALKLYCKISNRDKVAEALGISKSTLKTHISSIYHKTGFDNLSKLAIYCVVNGLIIPNLQDER